MKKEKQKEKPQKNKKLNVKSLYKIVFKLAVSVLVILSLAIIPTLCISLVTVEDKLSKASKYKGILELWNIDTFEGGTAGKSAYLTNRSIAFEKQNKGLYVMVKNYTEEECRLALAEGKRPALISFGVGVGEDIIDYLSPLVGNFNEVRPEFLAAGKSENNQLAVPYCTGMYSIITTSQKLESAGQTADAGLSSIVTSCGSQKTLKNGKVKTTYSVSFGGKGYNSASLAYNDMYGKLTASDTAFSSEYNQKSPYNAYCDFVEGNSVMLMGTQRDMARIENRYSQGKIDGVIYEHLGGYTDLAQFIGVCKTDNSENFDACQNFISFIVSADSQQSLSKIGMFSVRMQKIYFEGEWSNAEYALSNPVSVQNVFTTKVQIAINIQNCFN